MITALLIFAAAGLAAAESPYFESGDTRLSWSPQGDRLVYVAEGELVVVDAYSRQATPLGPGYDPTWSPVGDRILFTHLDEASSYKTFIVQADGSGRRRVGDGCAVGWSPSGDRYAYWRRVYFDEWKTGKNQVEQVPVIFIEDARDGYSRGLIPLGYLDFQVADWWSIGIVYYSVSGWAIRSSQYRYASIVNPDMWDPSKWALEERRHRGSGCQPGTLAWSAAASRLACFYVQPEGTDTSPPEGWVPERRLNVREIGGDFWEIGENLRGYQLSWSPDGQRLAFDLWLEEEDTRDIFVAEGERLDRIRRLTFEKGCCPHWSPAGDQIAYFSKGSLKFVQPDQPTGVRALSWGQIKNQHQ